MPKHRPPRRPLPPPPMRPEDEPDDIDLWITRLTWEPVVKLLGGPKLTDADVYEIFVNSRGFIRAFERMGVFVEPDPDDPERMRVVTREPKPEEELP
jgi:hypothetical protein